VDKLQISLDSFWPFVVMASSKSRSDFGGQGADYAGRRPECGKGGFE